MHLIEKRELYDRFLETWPEERVREIQLTDYANIANNNTFCYWVERETRYLGSILGLPGSIKFGIYKRNPNREPVAQYENDAEYSWRPFYGGNRHEAFDTIKREVLRVIEFSKNGSFHQIDGIQLSPMFKWKIAFLYSNERLVPIYNENVLRRIASHLEIPGGQEAPTSVIQESMIRNKPSELNVYDWMEILWYKFSDQGNPDRLPPLVTPALVERLLSIHANTRRRAVVELNTTTTEIRSVARWYVIERKHNKIQEALSAQLAQEFGNENVHLEENFVDVKLIQPKYITFYEVKSSSFALDCVRDAIGQLLLYSIRDDDSRPKRLVVVGQYPATPDELEVIEKLKLELKSDFSYQYQPLDQ